MAITRAGTTSLAEQELFDLQLVMIPIPWTHDQLQNARRYVEHKKGILIQQDDPEFIAQLTSTLRSLVGYKKGASKRDLLVEITTAKQVILDAMLQ